MWWLAARDNSNYEERAGVVHVKGQRWSHCTRTTEPKVLEVVGAVCDCFRFSFFAEQSGEKLAGTHEGVQNMPKKQHKTKTKSNKIKSYKTTVAICYKKLWGQCRFSKNVFKNQTSDTQINKMATIPEGIQLQEN